MKKIFIALFFISTPAWAQYYGTPQMQQQMNDLAYSNQQAQIRAQEQQMQDQQNIQQSQQNFQNMQQNQANQQMLDAQRGYGR